MMAASHDEPMPQAPGEGQLDNHVSFDIGELPNNLLGIHATIRVHRHRTQLSQASAWHCLYKHSSDTSRMHHSDYAY
jgi:hypothetical protein